MPDEAALRKKARRIGASFTKSGPRLTGNPNRAALIRLPSGKTISGREKEAKTWMQQSK